MKMTKELLKVRSSIKKRKPTYRRQQINQYAKFKNDDSWRRPKGHQSKMRLKRKGHRGMPTVGYGSPKAVRGLNKEGLQEIIISNIADLKQITSKNVSVIISRTVGARKKLQILDEAKKLKIKIGNVKDIDAKIKELTKAPKEKKAPKKTTEKSKTKKEDSNKKSLEEKVTKSEGKDGGTEK